MTDRALTSGRSGAQGRAADRESEAEARRKRALARHAYREAVDVSRLPPNARLLLRCLLDHGLTCHPSVDRLAAMSGMSKRTVIRQLALVERARWIERVRKRAAGGRLGGTSYRLRVPPGAKVAPGPGVSQGSSQVLGWHLLDESPVGDPRGASARGAETITPACWTWNAWLDWLQAAGRADLRDAAVKASALTVPALHPGVFLPGRVPLPAVPDGGAQP